MNLWRLLVSFILALILGLALSENAFAQGSSSANSNSVSASSSASSGKAPVSAVGAQTENRLSTQIKTNPKPALRKIEGLWNLQLLQKRSEDDFNQRTTTEFRLQADLFYRPLENVTFRLAPKFTYTNGFVQVQEVSQANKSEWGVKEASINADLLSSVTVSAGALDQEADHSALLLADQSFPSLRLKLQSSEKEMFSVGLRAETAVPTSSSLSTQTKEYEKTPSFNSGSLVLKLQKTVIEGDLKVGAYQFQNLPTSVATSSAFLGNTTETSTGGTESQFVYQYEGAFAAASSKLHFTRNFRLLASGDWVQNSKAPSGLNQGSRVKVGAQADLIRGFQIEPFYSYFRIEPDAAVAAYNHPGLNTNRNGYMGGLSLSYRKTLKITAAAGESDALLITPYQMREKNWFLKLETLDVAI